MDILEKFVECFEGEPGGEFIPYESYIDSFIMPEERRDYEGDDITISPDSRVEVKPIPPSDLDIGIVAIDSTSSKLGEVEDGVVGAIRATVIERDRHDERRIYRYGPYILKVTNQNADALYNNMRKIVFGIGDRVSPPRPSKLIDRSRSFLEKIIQLDVAERYRNSLILLDGSLITGTVDTPNRYMQDLLSAARRGSNSIVAISKRTSLSLSPSKRSILSVLDDEVGPSYARVKQFIEQDKSRYLGEIYVCRFFYGSQPFRTDIPYDTPYPHESLLGYVSGLCGPLGYPEELRNAHIHSIFTGVEYVELQSAAVSLYNMKVKDNIRRRLFGPYR